MREPITPDELRLRVGQLERWLVDLEGGPLELHAILDAQDTVRRLVDVLAEYKMVAEAAEQAEMEYLSDCTKAEGQVKELEAELENISGHCSLARERAETAEGLLRRLRGWDMFNPPDATVCCDAPYWVSEIDKVLQN